MFTVTTLPRLRAERIAHGKRGRYVAGCRCDPCRASNAAYYHERRALEAAALAELEPGPPAWERPIAKTKIHPSSGRDAVFHFKNPCPGLGRTKAEQATGCPWRRYLRKETLTQGVCKSCRREAVSDCLVPAARARRKLAKLAAKGVGYKAAGDAAGVTRRGIQAIKLGTRTQIRLSTERKILALDGDARAAGSLVPAAPTMHKIGVLLEEGFTRTALEQRLGVGIKHMGKTPHVTAATEFKVAKFFRAIMAVAAA